MQDKKKDIKNYQVELDMRRKSYEWAILNNHQKYADDLKREINSIDAAIDRLTKEV